jgi:hypothetical protein
MTAEWNNFVNSWHRKRADEKIDNKCKEHKRGNNCLDSQSWIKSISRPVDISVPVTVTPFAVAGKPTAKCAGEYDVNPKCSENESNSLVFTITQKMNVDIPVLFGAEICFDKAYAVDSGECNNVQKLDMPLITS